MRAQVLEAFNQPYKLRERQPPGPPTGVDLLIRVLAASYCHTDAVLVAGHRSPYLPRVGSHEFAGEIVEKGPEVNPSYGLEIGTRVGVPARAYRPCGSCFECRNSAPDPPSYSVFCSKSQAVGLDVDGGFQDYCIVDSRQVVQLPSSMSPVDAAPLMCAGLTVWNALLRAGIPLQENGGESKTIGILGAGGGLGHLGIQIATNLGCKVVAIEAGDRPLKLVKDIVVGLGNKSQLVTIVDARSQQPEEVRREACGESPVGIKGEVGLDGIIVLPENQAAFDFGMALLKDHATCVVVSFPEGGFRVSGRDLIFRDIKVIGCLVGTITQLRKLLDFAVTHNVRAITKTYPLSSLNTLVEDYHAGLGGKLVVDLTLP
ncbi:hypothetical protein RBB50_006758 [Rhinocladiella similis]